MIDQNPWREMGEYVHSVNSKTSSGHGIVQVRSHLSTSFASDLGNITLPIIYVLITVFTHKI